MRIGRESVRRIRDALHERRLQARRLITRLRFRDGLARALDATLRHPRFVLALSHSDALRAIGGTELYMGEERRFLDEAKLSYAQVFPTADPERVGLNVDGWPLGEHAVSDLVVALAARRGPGRGCVAVEVHQLLGWSLPVAERLALSVGAGRVRFFIHDYYSICPSFNLLFDDREFCGAPPVDSPRCASCKHGAGRTAHHVGFQALLRHLDERGVLELVAPSQAAVATWGGAFPHLRTRPSDGDGGETRRR
jgi:hypothetical protein